MSLPPVEVQRETRVDVREELDWSLTLLVALQTEHS